ncbi:hypothetical protein EFQ99_33830 [Rhizobium vallis]|uniref:Peptidase M10 metallopeptidase domain-containing protein n=2 Tax=Rhizobium TaxID=379 RepID=A0A2A6J1W6_9HYPH|nr:MULTISPECIES: matrixin family metalloprotease [Rhizobium]PDS27752.1 hypothetical protein CO650_30035 [Rhizobium phaseoli]PDT00179.1 hypothetical protein CO666_32035 [Rhizobium chutanense]RUM17783.1 hypothetical protein EFQ99_33830 [Rhizobium vallis]
MLTATKNTLKGLSKWMARSTAFCALAATLFSAAAASAYKLEDWNWKYQANPIEARFVICEQDAPSGAASVIKQAAAKWSYSKLKFSFEANNCPQERPLNYVEFVPLNVTGLTTAPNELGTHNTKRCLIQFNKSKPWYAGTGMPGGNQNDLFSVALHEFGHCIGLLDIDDKGAVMNGKLDVGKVLRDLASDDLAGRNAIYGMP